MCALRLGLLGERLLSSTECSRDGGQSEYLYRDGWLTVARWMFFEHRNRGEIGPTVMAQSARRSSASATRGRQAARGCHVRRSTLTPPDPTALHCIANAHRRAHAHSRGPREDTQIARSGHTHVCAHETNNVIVTPMAWTRGAALHCTRPNATLGQ